MRLFRRFFLALCLVTAPNGWAWAGKANDTLVAAFEDGVRTLDGNYSNSRENDILGLLIDDALFAVDPETARPVPLAAKSHELRDNTTLVVELRDDVLFHDGSKMTVDDVIYSYRWLLDPRGKTNFYPRFRRWLASVDAEGPNRVVFRMKEPYAMALYDLAMYSKVRKKGTHDDASKPDGVNPDATALQHNGTGPYRVVSFRPGQQIVLQRFDKYRADGPKGAPSIRNITIRSIPDWSTQAAEVMSGGVNWTYNIPIDVAEGAESTATVQLSRAPSMRTFYLSLDAAGKVQKDGPLTKLKVRQALNHATDREGIVKNLLKGGQMLHTACVPIQFGCNEKIVQKYLYDPAKAKMLLAEAGYPNGIDVELWAARDKPVVEAIVNQWRAAGIRASLRYVKGPTLSEGRDSNQIPIEFASSGSFGIPDAGALLPDRLGPVSPRNFSGDETVGALIMEAVGSYDEIERKAAFDRALKLISEQAYWVPLYTDSQNFLMTRDLSYTQSEDGMPRLYTARWK